MSDLLLKSKKDLVEIIEQLKIKLSEMKEVEQKAISNEESLPGQAFSIFQDDNDQFHMAKISYNADKLVAKIEKIENLDTKNLQLANYYATKELAEKIMSNEQITHNKGKK